LWQRSRHGGLYENGENKVTEEFILNFWLPFLLIFTRVAAFLAVVPFFAWRGVPVILRIFFSLVLAVALALNWEGQLLLPSSELGLAIILGKELLTGIVLGFLVYLFLAAFQMSGQFMDHKAGLMMAGAFDPLFGGQVTILGQFFYFLAVVFYLTVNGHYILFLSLKESFKMLPLAGPFASPPVAWQYLKNFSGMFLLAFQIAAPVIIVIWLTDLALGFLSRAVPQIHVFIVGLPLKIAFTLLVFLLLLPLVGGLMGEVFTRMSRDFLLIMQNW
jgi:flagellar biosynthetic protein FliR